MADIEAAISPTQAEVCSSYGSPLVPVRYDLKVGLAMSTLGAQPIHGLRLLPEDDTSGWYIWAGEYREDPDFYAPVHTAHLTDLLPSVIPYLGLVPGFRFIIDAEGYEDVWFDDQLDLG